MEKRIVQQKRARTSLRFKDEELIRIKRLADRKFEGNQSILIRMAVMEYLKKNEGK